MVEDIIKAVNHEFIYVSKRSFNEMKYDCKQKLLACSSHSDNKFKAFFDCKDLDENELIELLKLCNETNTIFMGFKKENKENNILVYNKKIYPGEQLSFYEDVLILQDIPKDSYIECVGKMLVLGKVKGNIDLFYKDCTITASSYEDARIRIFDSEFQNTTNFSCSVYYYENNEIKKEENPWDIALASPLVRAE